MPKLATFLSTDTFSLPWSANPWLLRVIAVPSLGVGVRCLLWWLWRLIIPSITLGLVLVSACLLLVPGFDEACLMLSFGKQDPQLRITSAEACG